MSVIEITRDHSLDREHARQAATDLADSLSRDFNVNYTWDGDTLHFKRSGVRGNLELNDQQIHLRVELGLLVRPFKDRIEGEIHKHLDHLTQA